MPMSNLPPSTELRSIRIWLTIFIVGLILSGVTAFPLVHETAWLARSLHAHPILPPAIIAWIDRVHAALADESARYPFLAYGTDWLAFAHLVIAIIFLGPLIDPVRNKWVLQFGIIACLGVFPLALIAGPIRGIPCGAPSIAALASLALFHCSSACALFAALKPKPRRVPR
jgi:hypothetical protein